MNDLPKGVYAGVALSIIAVGLVLNLIDAVSDHYVVPDTFEAVISIAAGAILAHWRKRKKEDDDG